MRSRHPRPGAPGPRTSPTPGLGPSHDAVWAAACLLHISRPDLPIVLARLAGTTREDGVLHLSLKEGDGEAWSAYGSVGSSRRDGAGLVLREILSPVTYTEFWARLERALGVRYYRVWADQQVIGELDGRTAAEALDAGVPPRQVWRAVWAVLGLPDRER